MEKNKYVKPESKFIKFYTEDIMEVSGYAFIGQGISINLSEPS